LLIPCRIKDPPGLHNLKGLSMVYFYSSGDYSMGEKNRRTSVSLFIIGLK
jgi:hypothetical protein